MSASERAEVNSRLGLIEREVANLHGEALARRLEAVVQNGDKVEQFCYLTAANAKEAAVKAKRQQASGDRAQTFAGTGFSAELDRLDRILFTEEFRRRTEPQVEVLGEAEELAEFCYTRSRDAKSMARAYRRQHSAIASLVERQKYERAGEPIGLPPGEYLSGAGGIANDGTQGERAAS